MNLNVYRLLVEVKFNVNDFHCISAGPGCDVKVHKECIEKAKDYDGAFLALFTAKN